MPKLISACLIVRDEEPRVERALQSIRPFVDELVVVDTGSKDHTLEIVAKYANKYESYTDCNDPVTGEIQSFAMARNRALALATHDWVVWMDADDTIQNAAGFRAVVDAHANFPVVQVLMPYEYSHDEKGICRLLHYRERLVYPRHKFEWRGGVHEVLCPKELCHTSFENSIRYIHNRHGKMGNPNRNINILTKMLADGDTDPRTLFYAGLEYSYRRDFAKSNEILLKYASASGWEEEICLALMQVSNNCLELNEVDQAFGHAVKAQTLCESRSECYFQVAKCAYQKSLQEVGKDTERRWLERCVHFATLGLSLPEKPSTLFVDPLERKFEVHRYLNMALNKLGRVHEALESVKTALRVKPDEGFELNRKVYEVFLSHQTIGSALKNLVNNREISEERSAEVLLALAGKNTSVEAWAPYLRPSEYPRGVQAEHFPVAKVTPHAQAFGIPETFVYDDLPLRTTDLQLQALVGAVWKEYMLHDEIMSAISLLENAPNRIRTNDWTLNLLRKTRKFIDWNNDADALQEHNTASAIHDRSKKLDTEMVPLDQPIYGPAGSRTNWITDRLIRGSSVCDLGSIDGMMTNRWGRDGFKVVGVDVCKHSTAIANRVAHERNTGARHIASTFPDVVGVLGEGVFDAVTTGDVYEHMIDPVAMLLAPARKLVKEDGQLLLTTPYGAWFRGEFNASAHPWLWANEGMSWLCDKPRAHLIAPTVWSVADHLKEAGFWVHTSTFVHSWGAMADNQGNVCARGLPTPPKGWPGLHIVFFLGQGVEDWTPNSVDLTGIGGSEGAAINMAKRLVALGNRVQVYSSCGKHGEGIYEGVEYLSPEKFHDLKCDVLVVSRWAPALGPETNVDAKVQILWVHDILPKSLSRENALRADRVFVLSGWHKAIVQANFPFIHPDQLYQTRNGINPDNYRTWPTRNPHKAVYSSSPDRGLPALLRAWPRIREQVPDAELHVFYGFKNWEFAADENQKRLILELKHQMDQMKPLGVHYRDRLPQHTLAEEFKSAGVWLFPTWFSETSCITAMEAQAAGLRIVTSHNAALVETVGKQGTLIEGDWLSSPYQDRFVAAAVRALVAPEKGDDRDDAGGAYDFTRTDQTQQALARFDWNPVAQEWDALFKDLVTQAQAGTLEVPYRST